MLCCSVLAPRYTRYYRKQGHQPKDVIITERGRQQKVNKSPHGSSGRIPIPRAPHGAAPISATRKKRAEEWPEQMTRACRPVSRSSTAEPSLRGWGSCIVLILHRRDRFSDPRRSRRATAKRVRSHPSARMHAHWGPLHTHKYSPFEALSRPQTKKLFAPVFVGAAPPLVIP